MGIYSVLFLKKRDKKRKNYSHEKEFSKFIPDGIRSYYFGNTPFVYFSFCSIEDVCSNYTADNRSTRKRECYLLNRFWFYSGWEKYPSPSIYDHSC